MKKPGLLEKGSRVGQIVIGIVIVVISIIAWVVITNIFTPPEFEILYAVRDLQPGEMLTPDMVGVKLISIDDPSPYIMASEVEKYGYHPLVEHVRRGELLAKASIQIEGSEAAAGRVSLSLKEGEVAMVIPVTPLTSPSNIVIGDRVDITISVGAATFLTGAFESVPTTEPFDSTQLLPQYPGGSGNEYITPQPTPTPVDVIDLPVSKTIVVSSRILWVVYEREFNPGSSSDPSQQQFVNGEIIGITVAVPRNAQEALAFAINNGAIQIAVRDPNADDEDRITPGISWDDLVAFFKAERAFWALTPQPSDGNFYAPGANTIVETVMAPYFNEDGTPNSQPESTADATLEPTPSPNFTPTATP